MQAKESLSAISSDRDLWIAQYRQEIAERGFLLSGLRMVPGFRFLK